MTDREIYEATVHLAVEAAKGVTREDVLRYAWLPFTLLYQEMIKRKEIDPLSELPIEKKREYWDLTEGKSDKMYKRIFLAQAVYVFDLIKQ